MDFTVETVGTDTCIQIQGNLTFDCHHDFRQILDRITAKTPRTIISLKELNSMDSTGVGMLKLAQDQAQKAGCDLLITDIPEDLQVFIQLLKE